MIFLPGHKPTFDLTYNDVFIVPGHTDIASRHDVNLVPADNTGMTFPIVVSNMNEVAGSRMAETIARRGGLAVLPQDIPPHILAKKVARVKKAHPLYDTPLLLTIDSTVHEAQALLYKRAHNSIIVIGDDNLPVGIVSIANIKSQDRFTKLELIMQNHPASMPEGLTPELMFQWFIDHDVEFAPVVTSEGLVVGAMTKKSALRATLYKPAVDSQGRLRVAAACGINGDVAEKINMLLEIGVDVIVIDTAHGDQAKMIEAIKIARKIVGPDYPIVAGNIVSAEGTRRLIEAGANIVKVGVGPGAMCTTRMMTGVGRPQFSAVLECAKAAEEAGGHIWADGGVRHPRDVALALVGGANSVMVGSWFAGTMESAADVELDADGRMFKRNYGMASGEAVRRRNAHISPLELAKKTIFQEGISSSTMYVKPDEYGAEDILDKIYAGVKSAATYIGASTAAEMNQKAIIGIQSTSGFHEGKPVDSSW